MRIALLVLLGAASATAQVRVYSEFQRVDPFGKVVAVDRAEAPREILSPAVPRNAWTSFHIAVEPRPGQPSWLYWQQNPDLLEAAFYREQFVKTAAGWIPDGLEKTAGNPAQVLMTLQGPAVPGQTTEVFWMDVWVPEKTPIGRMRLEVLLKTGGDWIVYPMELRVMEATVPKMPPDAGGVPRLAARADEALLGLLRHRLCGAPEQGRPAPPLTVRHMLRRNALQDLALGQHLKEAFRAAGVDSSQVCAKAPAPEWWLKVRYWLLRHSGTL